MSASGFTRSAGEQVGRYRLVAPLGRGGFSEVWRARAQDGAEVALKILLRPEHVAQIRAESDAVALVGGEGVVRVIEAVLTHDPPYVVLDVLEGGSLRERLVGERRYTAVPAIVLFERLLMVLTRVHREGVVHGDLKPENILFLASSSDSPWIADFGLSRRISQKTATLSVSLSLDDARLAGTLDYMAPEQRAGEKPTPRSDVFALGVILYELLVGTRPQGVFAMPSATDPSLPPVIDRLVACSLAQDPTQRFASAGAMLAFLQSGVGREWKELSTAFERLRHLGAADPNRGAFSSPVVTVGLGIVGATTLLIVVLDRELLHVSLLSASGLSSLGLGIGGGAAATYLFARALRPWLARHAHRVVDLQLRLIQQIQTGRVLSATLGTKHDPPEWRWSERARIWFAVAFCVVAGVCVMSLDDVKMRIARVLRPAAPIPTPRNVSTSLRHRLLEFTQQPEGPTFAAPQRSARPAAAS